MKKTYKDFDSRIKFVEYLKIYHGDRDHSGNDFKTFANISKENYQPELDKILSNIESIRNEWNNQSIEEIEKSVSKKGERHLAIMQGQKQDKLRAGYRLDQPMYCVHNCNDDSYFYEFAKEIGLENSLARYHVQFPGEVTAWHTDIFSPAHEFLVEVEPETDDTVGLDKKIRRILISLEEWDWGHLMLFGKTSWINWHAGDVIYWDYGVPHGSANMSYTPRISVSITGIITEKFLEIINKNA